MKPEKLVQACTSNLEIEALAYAIFVELGAKKSAELLRNAFFVNGDRADTAAILKALDDVTLSYFD